MGQRDFLFQGITLSVSLPFWLGGLPFIVDLTA
jgi:hypothetical protein